LIRSEPRCNVHEAGERRKTAEPAVSAAVDAELETRPEHLDAGRIRLQQRDRRLGQHERNLPLEPVAQTLALVSGNIVRRAQIDEHVVTVDRHREAAQLVRELVEGAARPKIEAGVVPVAGEDPVADAAAMQREAHVRAAVVDRVHLLPVREETDRVPVEVDDEPPRRSQLRQRRGANNAISCNSGHAALLRR
jgi:hypothetical protein